MPQLVKGGKWVFGWAIVGPSGQVSIPPAAFNEYGFRAGETILFLHGSRRSGGFGLARRETIARSRIPLTGRAIGEGVVDEQRRVVFPLEAGLYPGERLLVVRGSGLALGFVQQGPIYKKALRHPEIEVFTT